MNYTINGAYRNDNNLVKVRSAQLAESYLAEFEEMFVGVEERIFSQNTALIL